MGQSPELPKPEDLFTRTNRNDLLSRFDLKHLLACLLILFFYLGLLASNRLERAENLVLDYFFRHKVYKSTAGDIAVIEIDKESLQAIGPWPWPARYHAQLIRTLSGWGARAILFDFVILNEEGNEADRLDLQKAVAESGRVDLPVQLEPKLGKKIWIHERPYELEPAGERKHWLHTEASLEKAARLIGHNNLTPDADGVVRRIKPFLGYESEIYPYLGLKSGFREKQKKLEGPFDLALPLDGEGNFLIQWNGRWLQSFEHYPYSDVIRSAQALSQGMQPTVRPQNFKNKICIIGLTDPSVASIRVNPLESSFPSTGVLANVLQDVLSDNYLTPASFTTNAFCLSMVGFFASMLFAVFRTARALITGLALGAVWFLFSFWMFAQKGLWVHPVGPLLLILTLFIFSAIYNLLMAGREQSRLFDLATRDGLTGLYVIRHFRDILNNMVTQAQLKKEPLSVILMDIDNFKKINDTYGHPAGDMVLKQTAQIIASCFRSKRPLNQIDFAARYGGEEFIVMVRRSNLSNAAFKVAERIRKAVESSKFDWEGTLIPVTVSLGVATLHAGENIPDLMVRRADEALYRAKHAGKNQVCIETALGEGGNKL